MIAPRGAAVCRSLSDDLKKLNDESRRSAAGKGTTTGGAR